MAGAEVTPPPLHGPTAKEKKYDRQLRLWAASGQQALEDAHVLLLNSGSGVVGVETLKNLVLPGVGSFTIVDEAEVCDEDLGVNFFLEEESLGRPRAEETCRLLRELNPEVKGLWKQQSVPQFIDEVDLTRYTLILIVAPVIYPNVVTKLSRMAWELRLPLVYVHSVGFYAHFAIQLPPLFPIVDTHPDPTSTQDLRLLEPWSALSEYAKAQTSNLEQLSDHDHGHIPYLLLLLHYLERWKESHGGRYPENYSEKSAFRTMVSNGARTNNAEGGEENYDEAVAAVLKSLNPPSIPSGLREILEEEECKNPRNSSANFWIIANAISAFITATGFLPLPGSVPDMKAQSKDYIALQTLYRTKAQADVAAVVALVRDLEKKLDRKLAIDSKDIEAFCKGAAFVKLVRGRKLIINSVYNGWHDWAHKAHEKVTAEDSFLPILFVFMALDASLERVGPFTGIRDLLTKFAGESLKTDMFDYIEELFIAIEGANRRLDNSEAKKRAHAIAEEVQRSGPFELHNISSMTGGMVAQEIIKVLTKQYVPVNNTCLIDGVRSQTAVYLL